MILGFTENAVWQCFSGLFLRFFTLHHNSKSCQIYDDNIGMKGVSPNPNPAIYKPISSSQGDTTANTELVQDPIIIYKMMLHK